MAIIKGKLCVKCNTDIWMYRKDRDSYECHTCHKIRMKEWYDKTRRSKRILKTNEEKKASKKKYREDNAEYIVNWKKEHYRKNKNEILKKTTEWGKNNKDIRNKISAEYRIRNLEKYAEYEAKRRSFKLKATPQWANHKYIRLFYTGAKIEEKRTGKKVHVDHIYPLNSDIVCGLHCEDNLQLLFANDNLIKSNRVEI